MVSLPFDSPCFRARIGRARFYCRSGRDTASAEFAKANDGYPVTVLRNNEPVYFIISQHDFRHYRDLEDDVRELHD